MVYLEIYFLKLFDGIYHYEKYFLEKKFGHESKTNSFFEVFNIL